MSVTDAFADAMADTDWHERAACAPWNDPTVDPYWFVPPSVLRREQPGRWFRTTVRDALAVCSHCPVKDRCAEWARRNDIPVGVWGGECRGVAVDKKKEKR